jgi:hypothetical protein
MKIIISTILICLLLTVALCRRVSRKNGNRLKTKNEQCPNVKMQDGTILTGDQRTSVFPVDYQTSDISKEKAFKQTKAARDLLTTPRGLVLTTITKAADKLNGLLGFNKLGVSIAKSLIKKMELEEMLIFDEGYNRQKTNEGFWRKKHGFDIYDIIRKIGKGNGDLTERLGFLGFVGDLGTALMDNQYNHTDFNHIIPKLIDLLGKPGANTDQKVEWINQQRTALQAWTGNAITDNKKKPERGFCMEENKMKMTSRGFGVLDSAKGKTASKFSYFILNFFFLFI